MLLGMPRSAWLSALGAMVFGILILYAELLWFGHLDFFATRPSLTELARDIGIAFIVAGIVSLIYEFSTRSTAEHHKLRGVLQAVMATYIPEELWEEVQREVLHRSILRRHLHLKFALCREWTLPNGQQIILPPTQAVLRTDVRYDLYALAAGSTRVEVRHYLDQHMRDEALDLPRFERAEVVQPGVERASYGGPDDWNQVYSRENGCIEFAGNNAIKVRHISEDKPTTIHIERHEIIDVPGLYTMVMPEMVVPHKSTGAADNVPAVQLTLESPLPEDVALKVQTWFPTHEFVGPQEKNWTYDGVLLPGQGFSLVFYKVPPAERKSEVTPGTEALPVASKARPTSRESSSET